MFFSLRLFATVTTRQGALIIGGDVQVNSIGVVSTVACFNNSGWSRLDDLQSIRKDHSAIINGDKVYIIGGFGKQ